MDSATTPDTNTDIDEGDRVFVRAQGTDFGRTGTVNEIYNGPHSDTYVINLDGSGDAHVSRDRLLSAAELNNAFEAST